jgi:hypothetical protein
LKSCRELPARLELPTHRPPPNPTTVCAPLTAVYQEQLTSSSSQFPVHDYTRYFYLDFT